MFQLQGFRRARRPLVGTLVLFWACVLLGSLQAWADSSRVLVMPFETAAGDGRSYWLAEASSVLLTDELEDFGCSAIGRDERVAAFESLQLPVGVPLSRATVMKVAQLAGASRVITGTVALAGETLTVKVRDIDVRVARMAPEVVERGPLAGLLATYQRAARRLAARCAPSQPIVERQYPPLPAFEQYIKGLVAESSAQTAYLRKAVELDPTYDRARLALAATHAAGGHHEKAIGELDAVPKASASYRPARFAQALSLIELRRYDEAFARLKELLETRESAAVYNALGVIQLRRVATPGIGKATYFFNKARTADPGEPDFVFNLGYAHWQDRDAPAAVYWLHEAVRQDPADGDAHFVLGAALQATGATLEAAREKELARRLSSKYAEWGSKASSTPEGVLRGLERLQSRVDSPRSERAESAIVRNEQREQRELAAFHLDRGRQLFAEHKDDEAVSELRRAIYLAPYQSETHLLIGRIYLRHGKTQDAVSAFKISLWSEETVEAHVALGEAYLRLNDRSAARAEAKRALEMDPASVDAKALLERLGST